ncbi:hypothetical protein CC78DRAFT_581578 [Lojkania enalia]|uniref:Uncharacterized protein n=1 Tax=Lojkania enalia TaxID=147567 RepID=A0A9P4K8N6_9PLEO|nr:hypothetical protein CC78DRAFT_581578 [Didymosphaeria enalia]
MGPDSQISILVSAILIQDSGVWVADVNLTRLTVPALCAFNFHSHEFIRMEATLDWGYVRWRRDASQNLAIKGLGGPAFTPLELSFLYYNHIKVLTARQWLKIGHEDLERPAMSFAEAQALPPHNPPVPPNPFSLSAAIRAIVTTLAPSREAPPIRCLPGKSDLLAKGGAPQMHFPLLTCYRALVSGPSNRMGRLFEQPNCAGKHFESQPFQHQMRATSSLYQIANNGSRVYT